ncbi:MAG TPA: ester cyclase [Pyrinomonadaceae bacterium]|jgi:steroid delta-isomerase-like uncharacterized protein
MSTDNYADVKALVRRWFDEVWNQGRAETIDELFAPDGLGHGLTGGEPVRGPANFKEFHRAFKDAFPNIEVVVEDTIAEGDMVAARCKVRAHHEGHTLGFAATGRPIDISGICIARWRNGQIVEAWNNFDFLTMYQQLGVTPPPPENQKV